VKWRILVPGLVVVLALIALLASGFGHDPRALPSRLEGRAAPDFTLETLDGDTVAFSELRGRPVVLNFWSTWCRPCKLEHPVLNAAATREGDDGVVFLGVLYGDDPELARRYLDRAGSTYPTLVDPAQRIVVDYGVGGVPETYFIDRQGVVAHKVSGALTTASLNSYLEAIR